MNENVMCIGSDEVGGSNSFNTWTCSINGYTCGRAGVRGYNKGAVRGGYGAGHVGFKFVSLTVLCRPLQCLCMWDVRQPCRISRNTM